MTTERHIAVMSLMNDLAAPTKVYQSALRKAWRTATDSDENNAAKAKGNAALLEIEGIVREWVAAHPEEPQPSASDAEASDTVAYRSLGGRVLRCLAHKPGPDVGSDFIALASEDLPDGGICTFPDCGTDVLIPAKTATVTP